MTNVGSVYCNECWSYYHREVFPLKDKAKEETLVNILTDWHSEVFSHETKKAAELHEAQTGNPYCKCCYSTEVTRVTYANRDSIINNLPTNG